MQPIAVKFTRTLYMMSAAVILIYMHEAHQDYDNGSCDLWVGHT